MLIVFSRKDMPAVSRTHIEVMLTAIITAADPSIELPLDFDFVFGDEQSEGILVSVAGKAISKSVGTGFVIVTDKPFSSVMSILTEVCTKHANTFSVRMDANLVRTSEIEFVEPNPWGFAPAIFQVASYIDTKAAHSHKSTIAKFKAAQTFTA